MSGQPKEGVCLEARSESKGYYEGTTTDSLGNYRLRGLLPHTTYLIRVVDKKDTGSIGIERSSPESVVVEVTSLIYFLIFLAIFCYSSELIKVSTTILSIQLGNYPILLNFNLDHFQYQALKF